MMSGKFVYYTALLIAVFANVAANISLKVAVSRLTIDSVKMTIFHLLEQITFWIGLGSAAVLLAFYLVAIRNGPVSVAYVFVTSLAMIGMVLVEYRFFGVPLGAMKMLGILLVISGVMLVGKNG